MPVTVLICASCEVICELSAGLVGSWFFNCVTSSVRNVFCKSDADCAPVFDVDVEDVEDEEEVPFMVSSSVCDTVVPLLPIVVLVVIGVVLGVRCRSSGS